MNPPVGWFWPFVTPSINITNVHCNISSFHKEMEKQFVFGLLEGKAADDGSIISVIKYLTRSNEWIRRVMGQILENYI